MHLLLATTNKGKVVEMSEALGTLPLQFVIPDDLGITEKPDESGETFQANALLKAHFYHERSAHPTLADDSGIIVEALSDELGIHTRRWGAGPEASDEEWITHFLERMKNEKNKRARFVCALAFVDAEGRPHMFEGTCDGVITETLEADYLPGLPISACFKPDGYSSVFSALSIEQKNSTSHRGRALKTFQRFIATQI
ncbi:MAG: hypothetical protein RIQ56_278 [Candidatus Parcubacteria bacterium]